jgi:hypothetical protein
MIGDNALFRIAVNIFIGASSGYAAAAIGFYVLLPRIQALTLGDPTQAAIGAIPFLLGLTLVAKLSPRTSGLGSIAMALLVGAGAATALSGAVIGTLIPQARAAMDALNFRIAGGNPLLNLVEGIVMLAGAILTLAYFQFSARRTPDGSVKRNVVFELLAWGGRIFIAVTFGVLFAGVYMAALIAMIERLSSMIEFVKSLLGL